MGFMGLNLHAIATKRRAIWLCMCVFGIFLIGVAVDTLGIYSAMARVAGVDPTAQVKLFQIGIDAAYLCRWI